VPCDCQIECPRGEVAGSLFQTFTGVESFQTNLNNFFVKITERTLTTQAKSQEDLIRLIENLTAKENLTRAFELSPVTHG